MTDSPDDSPDDQPPMAKAMVWTSRLTGIGLEMSLPALAGYWLDGRWGMTPIFVTTGAILGFAVGMLHVLQLARAGATKT